jgi:hypothetical protein
MMIVTDGRSSGSISLLLYKVDDTPRSRRERKWLPYAGSKTIVSDDGTEGNGVVNRAGAPMDIGTVRREIEP